MSPELICKLYIVGSITSLVLWHGFITWASKGKLGVNKQAAKWCKKYLILILLIGFVLGHWFSRITF